MRLGPPVGASAWLTYTATDGLGVSRGGLGIVALKAKLATGGVQEGLAT